MTLLPSRVTLGVTLGGYAQPKRTRGRAATGEQAMQAEGKGGSEGRPATSEASSDQRQADAVADGEQR
jgi:hypothetical protein